MTQDIRQGCGAKGTGTYIFTLHEGEETQADIAITITPTMYYPEFSSQRPQTVLYILLEPFLDSSCEK